MAKTTFKIGKSSNPPMSKEDINSLIAKKSYELYEKRGRKSGYALQDWVEAEKIIKGKISR
ncbi:MAG: DUF2934 domain-containing protein [Candidatus Omnitrophica bacterium]|nr:DUF2934 domain-containing protein [Candidatus Omnitrophota bacterium]